MAAFDEFLVSAAPLVEETAKRVAAKASDLAPRRTGFLAEHITYEMTAEGTARVGWEPPAFYGFFVEFGTVNIPPQPHLRPAVDLA